MRLPAYRNIVHSIVCSQTNNGRRDELLSRLREILKFPQLEHDKIVKELIEHNTYQVQLEADLFENEKIIVKIHNCNHPKTIVWPDAECSQIALGHDKKCSLSFSIIDEDKGRRERRGILTKISPRRRTDSESGSKIDISDMAPGIPQFIKVVSYGRTITVEVTLIMSTSLNEPYELRLNDVLHLVKAVLEAEGGTEKGNDMAYSIMHLPFLHYGLPGIIIRVLKLSVYLRWSHSLPLNPDILKKEITELSEANLDFPREKHATDVIRRSLKHLRCCILKRLEEVLNEIQTEQLFPPGTVEEVRTVNNALKDVMSLCVVQIWEHFDVADPTEPLTTAVREALRTRVVEWCDRVLLWECSLQDGKEMEVCQLLDTLRTSLMMSSQAAIIFFNQFHISYTEVAIDIFDVRISDFVGSVMSFYLCAMRRTRDEAELTRLSQCSMRLFEAFYNLHNLTAPRGKVSPWEVKERLFEDAPVHWTATWQRLSREMLSRCRSLDAPSTLGDNEEENEGKDTVLLPTSLYSFLCIQKAISDDLERLEMDIEENRMVVTMRAVNIYCDNLTSYSNHLTALSSIVSITEAKSREQSFVRGINGIEQSSLFIRDKWRRFVALEKLEKSSDAGKRLVETAEKLVETTIEKSFHSRDTLIEVLMECRGRECMDKIAGKILMDLHELRRSLAAYVREPTDEDRTDEIASDTDRLSIQCTSSLLSTTIDPARSVLLGRISARVKSRLRQNETQKYYVFVHSSLQMVSLVLGQPHADSSLIRLLHSHSLPTRQLILQWYTSIVDDIPVVHEPDNIPSLLIRTAACRVSEGSISLSIHVVGARGVCPRDRGNSSVAVRLQLLPRLLFPRPIQSDVPLKSLLKRANDGRIKWRHTFRVRVSDESFFSNGSVAVLSLVEKDYLSFERVLGASYLPLARISFSSESTGALSPPIPCLLPRPPPPNRSPLYKVLTGRASHDRLARDFIKNELRRFHRSYSFRGATQAFLCQSISTLSLP